jgi:cytochrome b subunit of formate dehydrogenase
MGNEPVGAERPHPYCLVPDLGCGDRGVALPDRSRHLCDVFRQAQSFRGRRFFPGRSASIPKRVPRHSLVARLFHWIMAASMFTLLFTAFLPKVGIQFSWVTYHWIAGAVLTVSVIFHIIHASFWLDFWSIWPDRIDLDDAWKRVRRFFGMPAPPPRKFAKYPLENKLFHGVIILCGLSVILTGVFMMSRVRTIFFPRNPYLFSDMTWGLMYVLHGLAGVGLIALVMMHVYFGLRPEKRAITKSMIFGWMDRDFYLEEHDPERWKVETPSSFADIQPGRRSRTDRCCLRSGSL